MTAHHFSPGWENAIAAAAQRERRSLQALESTLYAARQSGDPVRVLCEALIRQMDTQEFTQVVEAMLAIWNAEPNPDEGMCQHYGARLQLADCANDVLHDFAMQDHGSYRISGEVAQCYGAPVYRRAAPDEDAASVVTMGPLLRELGQ